MATHINERKPSAEAQTQCAGAAVRVAALPWRRTRDAKLLGETDFWPFYSRFSVSRREAKYFPGVLVVPPGWDCRFGSCETAEAPKHRGQCFRRRGPAVPEGASRCLLSVTPPQEPPAARVR